MNRKILSAIVIAGTAMASQFASAADGTITFNGTITAETCTITGATSGAFTVALPTVATSSLAAANATAGTTPFSISLTGCTSTGRVYSNFEPGTNVDGVTNNLKTGIANLQVRLLNGDLTPIKAGLAAAAQNSKAVQIAGGAATLPYFAEYIANGAAVTAAGAVSTTVQYTLAYE